MFEIKHRTAKSKINCEELDPSPLSGVGIKNNTVFRFSVLRRSFRIQHLEWISPTRGPRKDAIRIFFAERRWRWRRPGMSPSLGGERFLLRLRQGQARDCHQNSKDHELLHYFSPVKASQVLAG